MRTLQKIGERNYELIRDGIKTTGSYDPKECFAHFEERLYIDEVQDIYDFLKWVSEDSAKRGFGDATYELRYEQFLSI